MNIFICFTTLLIISEITDVFGNDYERPLVKTALGDILGYQKLSFSGRIFSVFDGIPFAKPPIGELRFQDPVAIQPWKGKWDARITHECIQVSAMLDSYQGDEDCLYINVNVPREKIDPSENLDVIVHIHGGGYMVGSGHSYAHPEFLMDNDVIFVTFNYRLAMFGFLSTQDNVVPGNMGMKDQVLALKWVQDHISNFGGNPNSVTLTGLSSGSTSAHLHYLSPLSKGLFHRGFSQSGVATICWTLQEEPVAKAKLLAASVGCPTDSTQELVDCLRERPGSQIVLTSSAFFAYNLTPPAPFNPVVEKEWEGAFLSKNPYYLLAEGEVHDVPWITSNVADEGMAVGSFVVNDLEVIDKNWTTLAPFLLDYNYTLDKTLHETAAKNIRQFYFGDKEINFESFVTLVKLFGDRFYYVDGVVAARLQAKVNTAPVYSYFFNYTGDNSIYVSHGDDGKYLFYKMNGEELTANEMKMKDVMVNMLINYAKTGKPTIEGVNWEPTGAENFTFLNITGSEPEKMKLLTVDEIGPRSFWKSQGFQENDNLYEESSSSPNQKN